MCRKSTAACVEHMRRAYGVPGAALQRGGGGLLGLRLARLEGGGRLGGRGRRRLRAPIGRHARRRRRLPGHAVQQLRGVRAQQQAVLMCLQQRQ